MAAWPRPRARFKQYRTLEKVHRNRDTGKSFNTAGCTWSGDRLHVLAIAARSHAIRKNPKRLADVRWRAAPFRSGVRRTPPREATQIPGRPSPAGRSVVGRRLSVITTRPVQRSEEQT